MKYKIEVTSNGNHIANPLLKLAGREYETRDEACEAIYSALYDVIDGESGCEMVNREQLAGGYSLAAQERYIADCREYIMREGYAREDGVTATVEEIVC